MDAQCMLAGVVSDPGKDIWSLPADAGEPTELDAAVRQFKDALLRHQTLRGDPGQAGPRKARNRIQSQPPR